MGGIGRRARRRGRNDSGVQGKGREVGVRGLGEVGSILTGSKGLRDGIVVMGIDVNDLLKQAQVQRPQKSSSAPNPQPQ